MQQAKVLSFPLLTTELGVLPSFYSSSPHQEANMKVEGASLAWSFLAKEKLNEDMNEE